MSEEEPKKAKGKAEKVTPAQTFAEDMSEEGARMRSNVRAMLSP